MIKNIKRLFIFPTIFALNVAALMLVQSCGNAYNSHIFPKDGSSDGSVNGGIKTKKCIKGCFGVPKSWFDRGIVVDKSGKKQSFNKNVNFFGPCYFKVCPTEDAISIDAKEYVDHYKGGLFLDSHYCGLATFEVESIDLSMLDPAIADSSCE